MHACLLGAGAGRAGEKKRKKEISGWGRAAARGWPAQATRTSEEILVVKRDQKFLESHLFGILGKFWS